MFYLKIGFRLFGGAGIWFFLAGVEGDLEEDVAGDVD